MAANAQPKSLSDIAQGYSHDIDPGELEDLLESVKTLKNGSGWGRIELVYSNSDMNTIDITIKRKPRKQKSV